MTKKELAKVYRNLCSRKLTVMEAKKEIEDFLMVIETALKIEGKIKFKRVGTMEVVHLKPRRIANPNTKEPMVIYPPKDVRFRESLTVIKEKQKKVEV